MSDKPETVRVLQNHASWRHYIPGKPLPEDWLREILLAGQQSPTSKNSQLVSVIVVKNSDLRKRVAELAWNQKFIEDCSSFFVICGDLYKGQVAVSRASDSPVVTHQTSEGLITLCVDAGSVLRAMMAASQAYGLAVCPIGQVRADADKLAQPQKVIPIVGLGVGYPVQAPPIEPRFPFSTFVHKDYYHTEGMDKSIDQLMEHWKRRHIREYGEVLGPRLLATY
eukprot:Protomagalhaensia_wolfi_Nauph_80__2981@NODE_3055_length_907_cov_514_830645_g2108_i3_p1_GENE_NODE_3055_length_907_cov_514_830645_g2108_i3NODE_3055_length_907_cov_514_830645_g2108_i3_p1_ORF_typecomplete_len224_score24_94Nitroreductase/PF00881_24/2e19TM1586_NiRdase/PF14512_6/6_9e08DUF1744/PF08490_12/0_23_NODE_3055_length_907_cov_514_830645_g2108_i3166837